MSGENNYSNDIERFFKLEICPLADDNCNKAVEKYKEHKSTVRLVNDVFNSLIECKDEKCKSNEKIIKEKLEEFIKKKDSE